MKIFITGASSGIGAALAEHYANLGATLGLVARRGEMLEALKTKLNTPVALYVVDVSDAVALQQAAQDFMQRFGAPDIVIANAGVSAGTLTECKEDLPAFRKIMEINVLGMVNTFQPFIAAMATQAINLKDKPKLVGISSVAGIRGLPGSGAYSASKAAAINYLESLRVEMRSLNIAVITIAPGYIKTPMTDINAFYMPFLMEADVAARKMAAAIHNNRRYVVIPWQMGILGKLIQFMPRVLWDWIMSKAPRKSRWI
ncbi:MAG: SDR family oxidoreductase [Methylophilaceae bacterium]|nr:SDR family oxidoreductase [Methylophilaceae bacterium]